MTSQLRFVVFVSSNITMQNALIAAACTQKIAAPSNGADTTIMTIKSFNYFALNCVPDL